MFQTSDPAICLRFNKTFEMVEFAHLVDAVRSEKIGDSMMFILAPLPLLFYRIMVFLYLGLMFTYFVVYDMIHSCQKFCNCSSEACLLKYAAILQQNSDCQN